MYLGWHRHLETLQYSSVSNTHHCAIRHSRDLRWCSNTSNPSSISQKQLWSCNLTKDNKGHPISCFSIANQAAHFIHYHQRSALQPGQIPTRKKFKLDFDLPTVGYPSVIRKINDLYLDQRKHIKESMNPLAPNFRYEEAWNIAINSVLILLRNFYNKHSTFTRCESWNQLRSCVELHLVFLPDVCITDSNFHSPTWDPSYRNAHNDTSAWIFDSTKYWRLMSALTCRHM